MINISDLVLDFDILVPAVQRLSVQLLNTDFDFTNTQVSLNHLLTSLTLTDLTRAVTCKELPPSVNPNFSLPKSPTEILSLSELYSITKRRAAPTFIDYFNAAEFMRGTPAPLISCEEDTLSEAVPIVNQELPAVTADIRSEEMSSTSEEMKPDGPPHDQQIGVINDIYSPKVLEQHDPEDAEITQQNLNFLKCPYRRRIKRLIYAPPHSGKSTFVTNNKSRVIHDTDYMSFWKLNKDIDICITNRHELIPFAEHSLAIIPNEQLFLSRCRLRGLEPEPAWYSDLLTSSKLASHSIHYDGYLDKCKGIKVWLSQTDDPKPPKQISTICKVELSGCSTTKSKDQ